ncbi:hypothetical protein EGR_02032 [Echinococcus granulosus]|uniref:Uncharacterized protein n=1 Tax=Echinococcus granulosus TaxID=6210 RepID=W6UPN4_ECHGR|nr:hypothetical protein EGR_02032 [Echinococcus granulosus]EUB63228.1 hypothetical protein EGR_02032 [Echinococcus granulosus]
MLKLTGKQAINEENFAKHRVILKNINYQIIITGIRVKLVILASCFSQIYDVRLKKSMAAMAKVLFARVVHKNWDHDLTKLNIYLQKIQEKSNNLIFFQNLLFIFSKSDFYSSIIYSSVLTLWREVRAHQGGESILHTLVLPEIRPIDNFDLQQLPKLYLSVDCDFAEQKNGIGSILFVPTVSASCNTTQVEKLKGKAKRLIQKMNESKDSLEIRLLSLIMIIKVLQELLTFDVMNGWMELNFIEVFSHITFYAPYCNKIYKFKEILPGRSPSIKEGKEFLDGNKHHFLSTLITDKQIHNSFFVPFLQYCAGVSKNEVLFYLTVFPEVYISLKYFHNLFRNFEAKLNWPDDICTNASDPAVIIFVFNINCAFNHCNL